MTMEPADDTLLDEKALEVARRVNWYTPPERVAADTLRFLAEIMARGGTDDIVFMNARYSVEQRREAYRNAPPGLFEPDRWAYWGLMLLDDPKALPIPKRFPESPDVDWRGRRLR